LEFLEVSSNGGRPTDSSLSRSGSIWHSLNRFADHCKQGRAGEAYRGWEKRPVFRVARRANAMMISMMMTILEAAAALRARKISSRELTEAALSRARELQPTLHTFITLMEGSALARASALDEELARGVDRGPLHGLPVGHKDCFYTKGVASTDGCKLFADFVPDYDAAVVEKLDAAGMVTIGKTNMHELAYGITSQNVHYGGVRNPWRTDCIPGGSSGGSGAAVASGIIFCGTGTDTGGSVRIPSSFCGTVGLKTTFGRVSRYGCYALVPRFDTMGPLVRSVRCAALTYAAMAGFDERDPVSRRKPVEVPELLPQEGRIDGLRIGLATNFYNERVDAGVLAGVEMLARLAEQAGARIVRVAVPDILALNNATLTVQLVESSHTFGAYRERWDEEVGPVVRPLLERGLTVSAVSYLAAVDFIAEFRERFAAQVLSQCDVLLVPSTPFAAPRIDQSSVVIDGVEEEVRIASTRFQRGVNSLGLPALGMPCGYDAEDSRPYGAQIVGPAFGEGLLLRVGAAIEDRWIAGGNLRRCVAVSPAVE
jgi:aspartyl-tRNA(Asn)/glutamyl-tRNA(Gln) amidotransferase subunit A